MAIKKISANLLGNNAVTAASIAGGAISAADIADNSITAAKLSASTSPTFGGLDVNGTVTADGLTVDGTSNEVISVNSTANGSQINFNSATTSSDWIVGIANDATDDFLIYQAGAGAGDIRLYTEGAERLTILNDGNVGIGTQNPTLSAGKGLHIASNSGHTNLKLDNANDWEILSTTSGYLSIYDTTGGADAFTVDDSTGHIGIGTTSWTTTNGNVGKVLKIVSTNNNIIASESSTATRYLILEGRTTGRTGSARHSQISLGDESDAGNIIMYTAPSGSDVSERVRIDGSGDVTVQKNIQLSGGQTIRNNTDSGTRFHTHLATCSGYSGTGCVVLNTNIPSFNVTGNTMFSIRIEGFAYDNMSGGLIDMQIGTYSGEGNWFNASYTAQNIPDQWIGRIRIGKDSNDKTVIIFGHTNTSINYEIAATNFIQGFSGTVQSYAEGWTFTKDVTDLSPYSNIAEVYPKEVNKIGFQCRTNGSTFTSGSWSVVSGTIASATTDWNFGGYLNESTGKFTPKVPGFYTFRCGGWSSHSIASNNDRYAFSFAKNGSRTFIGGGNFSSGDSPLSTHSQTIYLNGTGDYVNLELFQSQSGTWGTNSHNFWYQGILENHGARGAYDLTIGN